MGKGFGKSSTARKKPTKAQRITVVNLMSSGKFEELANYIIDNNLYVPDMNKKSIDWSSVEEVAKWARECQEDAQKAANLAAKRLNIKM